MFEKNDFFVIEFIIKVTTRPKLHISPSEQKKKVPSHSSEKKKMRKNKNNVSASINYSSPFRVSTEKREKLPPPPPLKQ